jgi:hypothetical protein
MVYASHGLSWATACVCIRLVWAQPELGMVWVGFGISWAWARLLLDGLGIGLAFSGVRMG